MAVVRQEEAPMMTVVSALGAFTAQDPADGMRWHRGVGGAGVTLKVDPGLLRDVHPLTRVEGTRSLVGHTIM